MFNREYLTAISTGNLEIVLTFADKKLDRFTEDLPLLYAVLYGQLEIAIELLKRGAKSNPSALIHAATFGYVEILRELLNKKPEIYIKKGLILDALIATIQNHHVECLRELIPYCDDVNQKYDHTEPFRYTLWYYEKIREKYEETLLIEAVRFEDVEIVRELLRFEADANISNQHKDSPLHLAALKGHIDIIKELLIHGAMIDAVNREGSTPVHLAVRNKRADIVEILKNYTYEKSKKEVESVFLGGLIIEEKIEYSSHFKNSFFTRTDPLFYVPKELVGIINDFMKPIGYQKIKL